MTIMKRQKPLAAIAIRQVVKNTGASRIAIHQMALLAEMGYRVVVLAEKANADLVASQGSALIRVQRWPFKGPFRRFWFNRRVQSWCKRNQPELLISHGDVVSSDAVFMHNCVHLASERIHGRALPNKHEVAAIHDHILNGGQFKRVVANSRLMATDLQVRYGISEDKIEVNYPGYDPEQFNPDNAKRDRRAFRTSLGVGEDEKLIGLITSGAFKTRNVALFVEIAALLSQRLPGCRFLVVGKDDPSPYQRQAQQLGVDDRFTWRTTIPDVQKLYGALDVFVSTAHIETFGCAILEAMACATPVVMSPRVGVSELLLPRFEELVLDSYDPESWANCIESILSNSPEILGDQLADLATEYSHQRQYEKLKTLFHSFKTF